MQFASKSSSSLSQPESLDLNEQFLQAVDLVERTTKNVFITGRAGTGKSTLLGYFRQISQKKIAVLAPTGVAAVNVKGQTIHSFFKFKPDVTLQSIQPKKRKTESKQNLYQKLDVIIIDEISMVRADLLDCVDKFLRLNGKDPSKPFGGLQMVFIGDLYQLPPVVTSSERPLFRSHYESPYFFSAHLFEHFEMELIELEKIYRQKDPEYISLLNGIRNNSLSEDGFAKLNKRYDPNFEVHQKDLEKDFYIYLTPTNAQASIINEQALQKLEGRKYQFQARVSGDFSREYFPTAIDLCVKKGAQVMMLNNDAGQRWMNGTIGKITEIFEDDKGQEVIAVKLEGGGECVVSPYTWEIFKFSLDNEQLQSESVGTFKQYPLMLAWAVTIHKSQGKTFDKVILDMGRGAFAHGQTYVALSRCTSLEGMILKQPLSKKDVLMDYIVVNFLTRYHYEKSEKLFSAEDKISLIKQSIIGKMDLKITYLKATDEKIQMTVKPQNVGAMEYLGKPYVGLSALCGQPPKARIFRVDRLLELEIV